MADQLYRLLLWTLPPDLRRDFGDDMAQLFRDHRRELSGRPMRLLTLWFGAACDVALEAIAARRPPRVTRARWNDDSSHSTSFGAKGGRVMRSVMADFRHGIRLLRKYPASSALALATLAIGIGANTAIFSVVDRVLLQALPYPDPDKLVMLWEKRPREGVMRNVASPADYLDWRSRNTAFENMAGFAATQVSITGDGEPVQVPTAAVGWSLFDVLKRPSRTRPHVSTRRRNSRPPPRRRAEPRDLAIALRRTARHRRPAVAAERQRVGSHRRVAGVVPVHPGRRSLGDARDRHGRVARHPPARGVRAAQTWRLVRAVCSTAMDRLGQQLESEYPDANRGHGVTSSGCEMSTSDRYARRWSCSSWPLASCC